MSLCQSMRKDKPPTRQLKTGMYLNYRPLLRLSMDLKVMPKSHKGHRFILCIIDKVTDYLTSAPIYQYRSEEIGEALIENVISKCCMLDYIIMDLDNAFMLTLMNYLFKRFGIKIKTVDPHNHQSLQAEHGIKSLSNILTTTLVYNTFNSPNLGNYSPYKLVFGRKPKLLLDLESDPDIKVLGTYKDYYTWLNKNLQYLHKLLQECKSKRLALINKDRDFFSIIVEI